MVAGSARAIMLLSVLAAATLDSDNAHAAGAAYAVDTAEVNEPGACKVESWMSAAGNHDFFAATTPTCVVDMFRPVELSAQLARARADGEWSSGAIPKFKTNLVPTAIGSWLKFGVNFFGGGFRLYRDCSTALRELESVAEKIHHHLLGFLGIDKHVWQTVCI